MDTTNTTNTNTKERRVQMRELAERRFADSLHYLNELELALQEVDHLIDLISMEYGAMTNAEIELLRHTMDVRKRHAPTVRNYESHGSAWSR